MTVLKTPPLFLNQELLQGIRKYPLGAYSAQEFCQRIQEGQIFFLVNVFKERAFHCEIDAFRVKEITHCLGLKSEDKSALNLVVEYCDEERKGPEHEYVVEKFFSIELNAIFIVDINERSLYALNAAKAYRKDLEENWDKLWVPYK